MRRKNGFTLIELLVVAAIIAILAGLIIPAVKNAMNKSANKQNESFDPNSVPAEVVDPNAGTVPE